MAAAIRTIFAQPSPVHVRGQLEVIAAMLGRQFPKVEAVLREAARCGGTSGSAVASLATLPALL